MLVTVLLVIAAFFWGAIPTANVVAKAARGVDLREYGSGSVTASNAWTLMGNRAAAGIGVLDILKGAAAVWVAQAADLGLGGQMAVGIAAMAGHNWSPFLGFKGGRGLTVIMGVLLAVGQLELLMFGIVAIFGIAFFNNVPIALGIATLLLPLWSATFERDDAMVWGLSVLVALAVVKRLIGSRLSLPERGKAQVLLYRLAYDRDGKDRDPWVAREDGQGYRTDAPSAASNSTPDA